MSSSLSIALSGQNITFVWKLKKVKISSPLKFSDENASFKESSIDCERSVFHYFLLLIKINHFVGDDTIPSDFHNISVAAYS